MGFRVGATNLPVHNIDGAAAPVAVAAEAPVVAKAPVAAAAPVVAAASTPVVAAYNAPVIAPQVSYSYLPYATSYGYNTPVDQPVEQVVAEPAEAAPVQAYSAGVPIVASNVDAANSQYHAQDDLGQYNYGFSNPTQTKQELKTADGVTRGSYSYVDANGLVQTVNYISDAMGFRVAASNLPVGPAPDVAVVDHVEAESAVVDAYSAAPVKEEVMTPSVQYAYLPYAQNYEYYGAAKDTVVASASVTGTTYAAQVVAPAVASAPVVAAAPAQTVTYAQAAPVVAQAVASAPVVAAAPAQTVT